MELIITSVDLDGYCGRGHHPEKSDVGKTVTVLSMETTFWKGNSEVYNTDTMNSVSEENAQNVAYKLKMNRKSISAERSFLCATKSGKLLHLMEHEVKLLFDA